MSFDWKGMIRSVAPTIASTLGGPLAGMGVQALSEIVLGKPDGDEEELEEALRLANPEMLQKIKAGDQAFKIEMKKLNIDLDRMVYEDKASARSRQVALKDKAPEILAYLLTAGFFGMLGSLLVVAIPEANKAVIYTMIGSLGTVWIAAMAYFHGSSRGSAKKDVIIGEFKK